MDTSLTLPPPVVAGRPAAPEIRYTSDKVVVEVNASDKPSPTPADKLFVAQVVSARLGGTAFPSNPGEIAPPERTLRPYGMPMLPSSKAIQESEEARAEAQKIEDEKRIRAEAEKTSQATEVEKPVPTTVVTETPSATEATGVTLPEPTIKAPAQEPATVDTPAPAVTASATPTPTAEPSSTPETTETVDV